MDPKLAVVIERHGPSPLLDWMKEAEAVSKHFAGLVRAIVSQPLSGKAADTIYGRLSGLGRSGLPEPAELAAMAEDKLRAVGLSAAKARGVKDLAARVLSGALTLSDLHERDDEAVIEALTQVKGIGRWTAEMFLIFRLGRLDVLSTGDLGLRKGMMHLFNLRDLPDPGRMEELAVSWRPFRAVASWYLWRVSEAAPPHRTKKAASKKAVAVKRAAGKTPVKKAAGKKARQKGSGEKGADEKGVGESSALTVLLVRDPGA